MGYTRQIVKGITWIGSFRILTRAISFGRTLVLARILTPAQFGFFGIGALVLALSELLTETGINILLVQKKDISREYLNTAWVISIIRGFAIGIVMFLISLPVSVFFNMPETFILIIFLSLVPVIRGFINPLRALLIKDLRYKDDFLYNTFLFSVEAIVAIIASYYTKSAIGLVYGLLASALSDVLLSFILFKPFPSLSFEKRVFLEIVHHGKWLTANGVMNYLYQNIDNIVIGKILGASSLGLYDVIYKTSLLPLTEIADVVGKVTFPVYVKMNDDIKRLRNAYIKSSVFIFLSSVVFASVLIVFARQIILILLGAQWVNGVTFLYILAILGVFRAMFSSVVYPLYSLKKQRNVSIITFIALATILITIIPFTNNWGLPGASFSALLGAIVATPIAFYLLLKEFNPKS